MTLIDGPIFVTNSPAVARWLDRTVQLWLRKYQEAGYPEGPLPEWMFAEHAALQSVGGAGAGTLGTQNAPKSPPAGLITAMEAANQLGVHRKTVNRWCRNGPLVGIRQGRSWLVDSRSVDEKLENR